MATEWINKNQRTVEQHLCFMILAPILDVATAERQTNGCSWFGPPIHFDIDIQQQLIRFYFAGWAIENNLLL